MKRRGGVLPPPPPTHPSTHHSAHAFEVVLKWASPGVSESVRSFASLPGRVALRTGQGATGAESSGERISPLSAPRVWSQPRATQVQTVDLEAELQLQHFYFVFIFFLAHFHFPASGQAVVTGVVPSPPRFLPSIFIAHRIQQSRCSSIIHRVLLSHALALSASQFVHKKRSQRIYANMHSAGLELTKLTYTRLEDNLIRHRGDRSPIR